MGDAGTMALAADSLRISQVQTNTAAKTFNDQTFKQRNPANTQTLTWINPPVTTSQDHYLNDTYIYVIFKIGSNYYCQNGITGGVESSGAEPGPVFHYAIQNGAGLGKILIKAGTYTFDAVGSGSKPGQILTVYDNTTLEGEGMYNTILVSTSNTAAVNFFANDDTTNGNSGIVFKNFKIDHSLSNNKATVSWAPIKNVRITNMYIKNGASSNFNFYVSGRRNGSGIPDMWVDNFYADGCLFESSTSCAWDNFGGGLIRDSNISNCVFGPSGGSAGFAQRLMENTTVTNCISKNSNSSGFNMEAGLKNVFSNCIAHDCVESGFKAFWVGTGGPPVDGFPLKLKFSNCQSFNNKRGFQIEGMNNQIVGCHAWNNSATGIDTNGDYNLITSNSVFHNGTNTGLASGFRGGIYLSYTARTGWTYVGKNVVSNNYCFDDNATPTQSYGVHEGGVTVNNNYILDNSTWGNTVAQVSINGAATIAKYTKTVDSNNEGFFLKRKINGAVVEVQI